jgi:hypothetical protein
MSSRNDYEKTIERLTILFHKGELSEESYLTAIRTSEEKMNKKNIAEGYIICYDCKKVIPKGLKVCPYCSSGLTSSSSSSHTSSYIKPTRLWYLVPILFALLGGIIGYVGVKDEDKEMAESLLIIGVVLTFFDIVVAWAIYM